MRRGLVPVDGTELSASILPDARRLAGADGTLILVRDAGAVTYSSTTLVGLSEMQEAETELEALAEQLRGEGVKAEAHTLVLVNAADAIDTAATVYGADMVACATKAASLSSLPAPPRPLPSPHPALPPAVGGRGAW